MASITLVAGIHAALVCHRDAYFIVLTHPPQGLHDRGVVFLLDLL